MMKTVVTLDYLLTKSIKRRKTQSPKRNNCLRRWKGFWREEDLKVWKIGDVLAIGWLLQRYLER